MNERRVAGLRGEFDEAALGGRHLGAGIHQLRAHGAKHLVGRERHRDPQARRLVGAKVQLGFMQLCQTVDDAQAKPGSVDGSKSK